MNIKMNRIMAILVTLMLMLILYACGEAGGSGQNSPDATVSAGADGSAQQAPSDTTASDKTDGSIDGADEDGSQVSDETDTPAQTDEPAEETDGEQPEDIGGDEEMTTGDSVVALAKTLIGAVYEWGSAGPDTFDNSGFVYYCFKENGITLSRKTSEMFAAGTSVEQEDLVPGDLVFFTFNDDRSVSYVGLYIGDGQFIAQNNEKRPVSIQDMTLDYYIQAYVGARRYI